MKRSFVRFDQIFPNKRIQTRVWEVKTTGVWPVRLGVVKWHAQWRGYAFFPEPKTLFEEDCLRVIADFVQTETLNRREFVKETA